MGQWQLSFVDTHKVSVHLYRVDVPDHLGLGQGSYPPQLLEESVRHLIVELAQISLDLALHLLDNLHNILCIVGHALLELELPFDVSLLMELHVA